MSLYENTYFNKLPKELFNYIWLNHYISAAKVIQKHIRNIWFIRKVRPKFKLYISCKCCKRHQINKPKQLEKLIKTGRFSGTEEKEKATSGCSCYCRCKARWLCRGIDVEL